MNAQPNAAPSSAFVLEYRDNGAIAVLTINRPRRGNALDSQTLAQLHRILDEFNGDPALRAVVLTGSDSVFCAGADIKARPDDFIDHDATPFHHFRAGRPRSPPSPCRHKNSWRRRSKRSTGCASP